MQDAILLSDPRGRAQSPNDLTVSKVSSAPLSSTLARGERQADTVQNPDTRHNHGNAHAAWSAHMQEHTDPETTEHAGSIMANSAKTFADTSPDARVDNMLGTLDIMTLSTAQQDPRAEDLSPHFQFAEHATPAPNDPAELLLLGPDGRNTELPTTGIALEARINPITASVPESTDMDTANLDNPDLNNIGLNYADLDRVNLDTADLDVIAADIPKAPLTSGEPNIERVAQSQDASDIQTATQNMRNLLLSDSDVGITLDSHGNRLQNNDVKLEATTSETIIEEGVERLVKLDLRTPQADWVSTEDVLEDVRFSNIVNHSTDALAKDFYVKTEHTNNALGLVTGLAQNLASDLAAVTDAALALESPQFSLGTTPSVQTSASVAVNAAVNMPIAGPNTVAIVSEAILLAKETAKGVTVQLDPPEMGRVYIDFIFEADRQVNVVVKTETLEAQHMLRERSEDFLSMLKEEGLDGATLSFEFHDNQGFEGFDESFGPNASETIASADDSALNPVALQSAYSKNTAYTDGLDLRL